MEVFRPDEVLVKERTSDNHLYVIVSGALGVVGGVAGRKTVTIPGFQTLAPRLAQADGRMGMHDALERDHRQEVQQVLLSNHVPRHGAQHAFADD